MNTVHIIEVGARDGLQNEKTTVATQVKLAFIQKLIACGLKTIEATSFVSPKRIPQLADHVELVKQLPQQSDVQFPVLVPNEQGLKTAIDLNVKDIAVFAAASNTFSLKNINRSIEQSLIEYEGIIAQAREKNMRVRGYVSCVIACPYEGPIAPQQVAMVAKRLFDAGCSEISLGDTIGVGTPAKTLQMLDAVLKDIPAKHLALHMHDTYGQALANIYASLAYDIRRFDSSVAGLGGCPYAKGATGNVATEEVIYLLENMGFDTGVNLNLLIDAGEYICAALNKTNQSKVAKAILAKREN